MFTWLYRAAVLAMLYKLLEQQRETQRQLRALAHYLPPREFVTNNFALRETDWTRNAFPDSSSGVTLKQPSTSFSASRSTTTPTTTTTAPTEASGRSDETSGETGEGFSFPPAQSWLAEYSKISPPTPDTSPEAGSPGPAPASSATGPEHNHYPREHCPHTCPAYANVQREKAAARQDVKSATREQIWAAGYDPVCAAPGPHTEHTHLPAGRHKHVFDQFDRTANTVKCQCGTAEEEAVRRAQQDGVW